MVYGESCREEKLRHIEENMTRKNIYRHFKEKGMADDWIHVLRHGDKLHSLIIIEGMIKGT